ncbi:MAG: inositol monophosphatase [Deltaproteobacteria bacterium]|nr:inositol monophosphatase [Deltaproteobacteria bacterium]
MTAGDLSRALAIARAAARAGGALAKTGRRAGLRVHYKGEVDLVTECDRQVEALVAAELRQAFPDHLIVGEEGSSAAVPAPGQPVWYIDPIDGTTNFAHGMPWYAVSIGLELDGERQVGALYAPETEWELWAVRGGGAFFNERPLRVSETPSLTRALVATGFPYDRAESPDNNVRELGAVLVRCQGIRRVGVASIDCAMLALGWIDAYWELKLNPWDVSAGALIVEEAGGRVTKLDGTPFRSTDRHLVASNGRVHEELLAVLRAVREGGSAPPVRAG